MRLVGLGIIRILSSWAECRPGKFKNKYANAAYGYIAHGHEPMQSFLISVPNKGFIYYGIKEASIDGFKKQPTKT